MLMPSIFGESFLNDFIEPFETSSNSSTFMNTDVEENEKGYMITMDIPGVHKEDVHAELKDGTVDDKVVVSGLVICKMVVHALMSVCLF